MPEKSVHKKVRHTLVKIGEMEGYDAKTEWPSDDRFDGAWLGRGAESPTHVFEVHVSGNPDQAITRLMRARNRWGNCEIRLVTTSALISEMRALVDRTLPQKDKQASRVINTRTIERLMKSLAAVRDMREEMGYHESR